MGTEKQTRTVRDANGMPVLEILKLADGTINIFEADNMDHNLQFSASIIPSLIQQLETLK